MYYDSIGLLSPRNRTGSNYRLYSASDLERMELIAVYRESGMPLKEIARVLSSDQSELEQALLGRLRALESDIERLRQQQRLLAKLLPGAKNAALPDKEQWVEIMRASGFSDEDMGRWHQEFERLSPEGHHAFLRSLGIGEGEARSIRERAAS